jgi:predicted peptidase
MGGYGTWEFIQRWPELAAAAIPVCGGGDVTQAARVATLPIWAFHGDQDTVIPPARTQDMITAIEAAGGAARFTLYPGVGHGSWGPAFTNTELLPWLFSQRRK